MSGGAPDSEAPDGAGSAPDPTTADDSEGRATAELMAERLRSDRPVSWRVEGFHSLEDTSRRAEVRRLAAAARDLIEHLVSTTAPEEDVVAAADRLEELVRVIGALPSGQAYEGFREAANAGGAIAPRAAGTAGRAPTMDADDPERFAFFDHSPFIGLANPLSPPMTLDHVEDRIVGRVTFGSAYEGPPGCVHGGYIAAVFDEVLGATQSLSGVAGMTARLEVDYRRPTPLLTPLTLTGWLHEREGRKIRIRGTLHAGDELTAEAEGLFIAFDAARFGALLEARNRGGSAAE
ncbi:MAG: PaaI family thioesterase [Microthrixaceae bacterium]